MTNPCRDQQDDISGQEAHRLSLLYPCPATIVKSASVAEKQVFADEARHKYPCDTAADVWLSTLFFLDKRANYPDDQATLIGSNLKLAARHFGIQNQVDELQDKFAADQLPVDEPVDYALVWQDVDGKTQKNWPMRNAEEVKEASAALLKHRALFTFEQRKEAAAKILRTASRYDAVIPEATQLRKVAARGACSSDMLLNALNRRAELLRTSQPEYSVELTKIAAQVLVRPATAVLPENLVKMASTLDQLDRGFDLQSRVELPEDQLFQISLDDVDHVKQSYTQFPTGSVYSKIDLERLSVETLQEWFGDEFAKKATIADLFVVAADTLADAVAGLSEERQQLFDKMAASVGIQPVLLAEDIEPALPMSRQLMSSLLT